MWTRVEFDTCRHDVRGHPWRPNGPEAVQTVRGTRKNAGGTRWVGCKLEPFSAYFSGIGDEFDAENGENGENGKLRPGR